ncbi:syncytin-1-like [Vanacampus margaritifer]
MGNKSIAPPHQEVLVLNTSCWGFKLWAYSSGKDPYFPIIICENGTMIKGEAPVVNNYTRRTGTTAKTMTTVDDWFMSHTGARPVLKIMAATVVSKTCLFGFLYNKTLQGKCSQLDWAFPLTNMEKQKPIFDIHVAQQNFTCLKLHGSGPGIGNIQESWCNENVSLPAGIPLARADVWLWCGERVLYDRLPPNASGKCALVTLIMPISVTALDMARINWEGVRQWGRIPFLGRKKRDMQEWLNAGDPTYIDAIGVLRGVPDEYKLVDQVAAGWESIFLFITVNKNVDRINYVHYNVQRLANFTTSALQAVHEQLAATSLMAFQNRMSLDMVLAERGGVCGIFGEQCCTLIPNNTSPDGRLTKALEGLRTLSNKMKEHSGVDTSWYSDWLNVFGKYKSLIASVLIYIAMFAAIMIINC